MTIDKDFLSDFSQADESDDYKRTESIQIGFEQELKSLTVNHGDSARFEAKISSCRSIDRSLLHIEWRLNDICILNNPDNSKYQFGSFSDENRYWMEIQQCQQQDEKVYTIHISYDNGRLHDESSAYLFVNQTDEQASSVVTVNEQCLPPTIVRSLQSTYRYHPGEQLHFLVEYRSPTNQCHCTWRVQYTNDTNSRSIEDGLIVNADCSSILIIESITAALQGLYTFDVENIYGRVMTQTIVIVNNNDRDLDLKEYDDIRRRSNGSHQRCLPDTSSSTSSDYEDVRVQTSNEEVLYATVKGKPSSNPIDISSMKDLYGQRHIAYFDPACKFDHVESIEQLENDDSLADHILNGHGMKNGHDTKIRIPFELPPPPPIEDIFDEHIYEDIPNIPQTSTIVSVSDQSNQIIDQDFSTTEQNHRSSPSPNSLVEVLNHVEQWSDTIVDNDTVFPLSPRQSRKVSSLSPSLHEYVDEGRTNGFHEESSIITRENEINLILVDHMDELEMSENGLVEDESSLVESYADQITYNDAEDDGDDEKSVSPYLLDDVERVVETIHIGDELFQAEETFIVGLQAPNDELSSDNESTSRLTSITSFTTEDFLPSDAIDKECSMQDVHDMEQLFDTQPNQIVDYIDIPPSKTHSDDQKPEMIIVTTEEISPNSPSVSDTTIESERPASNLPIDEQMSNLSPTNINDKSFGDSLESLSVPAQTDLLPLATMPDQTTTTDEQRVPDRTVQDLLSASLEPTKANHHESLGETMPNISLDSTEKLKDNEEFFDAESEKPPITLAEAEKLQHHAAIEQKEEDFNEPELDLDLPKISPILEHASATAVEVINRQDVFEEIPVHGNQLGTKKTDPMDAHRERDDKESNAEPLESIEVKSIEESPSIASENHRDVEGIPPATSIACQQGSVRPKFSVRLKPTISTNAGDDLKLEVHFIGQPEPKVTWYFKSTILKPSSNIHIIQSDDTHKFSSILIVEKLSADYEGKFKVIIKNDFGEAVSVAQINVKRALITIQLHTPTKKTGVGKPSTRPITNE